MATTRPTVRGFGGSVAAGHYLAAQIGAQQLASGGNAADAACAMGFALWVLEPTQNGPGGEVPILVRAAGAERVVAISGQGPAPAAATIERVRSLGLDLLPPDGLLSAAVPAALDAWCRLLEAFGTRRLAEVMEPARNLAAGGFPMYPFLRVLLELVVPRFERDWPSSAAIYAPLRADGARQTNPPLAGWLDSLMRAERDSGGTREQGIRAARDAFYRGAGAEAIARFLETPVRDASGDAHAGWLVADDLATYEGAVEEAVPVDFDGAEVWKTGPWGQGPVFLQQLRLLEGAGLGTLAPGGAEWLHLWIETAKLAFADRDACYGDPRFAEVPLETLLSRDYADARRALVGAEASRALRPGMGSLPAGWPLLDERDAPEPVEPGALAASRGRTDTTQCAAADARGNVVCATPSGGWIPTSPVVPGLGFPVGTRLQMAALDPTHPNALAPGKRPRTTLSPSLARLADGRWLAFGTPGGDQQDQWTSQFFLRVALHGERDLQAAIDAPTVHSAHMPSSFYPRRARPGVVAAESRIDQAVLVELEGRGHRIERSGPWDHGRVMCAASDPEGGPQEAAASSRFAVADAIALP